MQKKKTEKQLLAGVLAAVVCVSAAVEHTVPAIAATKKPRWIQEFEDIPEDIRTQKVELGTAKEDLNFPKYLRAEVEYENPYDDAEEEDEEDSISLATESDAKVKKSYAKATDSNASRTEVLKATDSNASGQEVVKATDSDATGEEESRIVDIAVVWEDLDAYDMDEPGIYEFQAELKDKQDILAEAVLPMITVEVEEAKISLFSADVTYVSTWVELQNALEQGGDICLTGDITADDGDSCLEVQKNASLNLNGYTINRNSDKDSSFTYANRIFNILSECTLEINNPVDKENGILTGARSSEGAIHIEENGTLIMNAGRISGNCTGSGGVYVEPNGKFYMNGGEIVNNTTTSQGAGVYLWGGEFEMTGGKICQNNAVSSGAGIFAKGFGGTIKAVLNITGGEISGNTVTGRSSGGGIALFGDSTLTMTGGLISGNNSGDYGAGIYLWNSTFIMTGGEIVGNGIGRINGGSGVAIEESIFNMEGGSIRENEAADGAGVYLMNKGKFIMSGGSIEGNKADSWGGGIYCQSNAQVELNGGQIRKNSAQKYGGGVANSGTQYVSVSGPIQITENTSGEEKLPDNLYNKSLNIIYVTGALGEDAQIGISTDKDHKKEGGVVAKGSEYQIQREDYQKFFSDDTSFELMQKEDTIVYHCHSWSILTENNRIKKKCSVIGCGEERVVEITAKSVDYTGKSATVELEYNGDEGLKEALSISYSPETQLVDAGFYSVILSVSIDGKPYEVSVPFEIRKASLLVKGKDQIITVGENISQGIDQITAVGLMDMDKVAGISLTADTDEVTAAGNIIPSEVQLTGDDGRSVNDNYDVTYEPGRLVIWPAEKQAHMTVGSGSIAAEYRVADNAPQTTIENLTAELAKELLTSEELRQVEAGEHVLVYLDVMNIDDTVSAAERSLVEAAAHRKNSDMQVGMYLDLSLYKKIGYAGPVKLSSTKGNMLQIQIRLPQSLVPVNDEDRTFYVVRAHNGAAELIPAVYDADEKTLTFETDRFSTYAIVYTDAKKNGSGKGNTNQNSSSSEDASESYWWSGRGTGWNLKLGTNDWYYIENGGLKKGWHYDTEDGRWYHLDETTGVMDTRWHEIRGIWYYFNDVPTAQTWFMEGGEWHYRKETEAHRPYGSMYANEMTPDGWQVDENGGWISR